MIRTILFDEGKQSFDLTCGQPMLHIGRLPCYFADTNEKLHVRNVAAVQPAMLSVSHAIDLKHYSILPQCRIKRQHRHSFALIV